MRSRELKRLLLRVARPRAALGGAFPPPARATAAHCPLSSPAPALRPRGTPPAPPAALLLPLREPTVPPGRARGCVRARAGAWGGLFGGPTRGPRQRAALSGALGGWADCLKLQDTAKRGPQFCGKRGSDYRKLAQLSQYLPCGSLGSRNYSAVRSELRFALRGRFCRAEGTLSCVLCALSCVLRRGAGRPMSEITDAIASAASDREAAKGLDARLPAARSEVGKAAESCARLVPGWGGAHVSAEDISGKGGGLTFRVTRKGQCGGASSARLAGGRGDGECRRRRRRTCAGRSRRAFSRLSAALRWGGRSADAARARLLPRARQREAIPPPRRWWCCTRARRP